MSGQSGSEIQETTKESSSLVVKEDVQDQEPAEDSEGDQELVTQSKARHKRRLQARWKCKIRGHSYCFAIGEQCHIQLTDENIDEWVNTMDAGYATLVDPPESVVPAKLLRHATDANSVNSRASRNTISYKRPFVLFSNPNLTDFRSWHDSLADRASSSSSGNSGPGFIAGSLLSDLGKKIIEILTPLEIRRRLWVMGRLIKRMEKEQDKTDRSKWLKKKERALNRLVDDILELSTDSYPSRYQTKSLAYAGNLRTSLLRFGSEDRSKNLSWSKTYWIVSLRVSPLDFLRENTSIPDTLAIKLRELLLQERIEITDFDPMIAELILCACNELNYGLSCTSRRHAFEFLTQAYFLPIGRKALERLARPNGPLEALAHKVFSKPEGIEDHAEHACGVQFFVSYANDHVSYRHYVLGPNGLFLVPRLGALVVANRDKECNAIDWKSFSWLCRAIGSTVHSEWLVPALLERDMCNVLCSVLTFHQHNDRPDYSIDYWIICTMYDLLHVGDEPGLRAVRDSISPETQEYLRHLGGPTVEWQSWMTKDVASRISEILEKTSGEERVKPVKS